MKLAAATAILAANALLAADDAHALLAKARAAYLENHERERYWNWTTITTRQVLSKDGHVLDEIPAVTVESPIRSDGKRCNAVLAWGDGREPYLANASADERCQVEKETQEMFRAETLLETAQVRVRSRSASGIVLAVRPDPELAKSSDPYRQCAGAIEGVIELDRATFFPRMFDLAVAGPGCEQVMGATNHYDDHVVIAARSTLRKGATLRRVYELQHDKSGNASKDYWILVQARSVRPLRNDGLNLIVWSRRFELHPEKDRRIVVEARTTASELASDVTVKFTEGK
jgi:hypothetical protein